MTESQRTVIEEKIWKLLNGYENIYSSIQPTLTYSIEKNEFCMKKEILEKLPPNVSNELLKLLKICID